MSSTKTTRQRYAPASKIKVIVDMEKDANFYIFRRVCQLRLEFQLNLNTFL
jgi:hypothetical protein